MDMRRLLFAMSLICFAVCLATLPVVAQEKSEEEEPPVQALIVKSGGGVAATPISIPRPIRLDRLTQFQLPPTVPQSADVSGTLNANPQVDSILSADIASRAEREVRLRVTYRYNPARPQPVYAGAFVYDAQGRSVGVGYRPAVAGRPQGFVEITLVLPEQPFRSNHIVTFFMESGKPVFMNARFAFGYTWDKGILKDSKTQTAVLKEGVNLAAVEGKEEFCRRYAEEAVAQYKYAVAQGLPGIVAPVWSDDSDQHYRWCLTVPRETALAGWAARQAHIEKHAPKVKPPDAAVAQLEPQQAESKEEFARRYAQQAVEQYKYAASKRLPGIVPPVWSGDFDQHYRWCLTAPREVALAGSAARQAHIDKYVSKAEQPATMMMQSGQYSELRTDAKAPIVVREAIKAGGSKQLDPGLGP